VFLGFGHEESAKQKKIRMEGRGEATVTEISNFSRRHGQKETVPVGEGELLSLVSLSRLHLTESSFLSRSKFYSSFRRPFSLYCLWNPYSFKRSPCGARPE